MATTRIMPLHVGKGRTESRAISDIIDYVANPKKTDNGRLITGYACDSRTADAEFLLANDFEELLKLLQESGCEVAKRGKSYRLKLPGMEENFIILGLRKKNRLVIHKHLRCMDVPIAAAADIKQNVSINMMMKKMQRKIRS